MTELRDDAIQAMLRARADRAPVVTMQTLTSPRRVDGRRPGVRLTRAVSTVAVGVVAVLIGVAVVGRVAPAPSASLSPPASSASVRAAEPAPGDWSYAQLSDALAARELQDDSVVLLRGAMERGECAPVRASLCTNLQVHGLDGVEVSLDLPVPFEQLLLEGGSHALDALMAFRVEGSRLRFLGWPDREPNDAVSIHNMPPLPVSPATLVPVAGWLGGPAAPASCPMGAEDATIESICTGRPAVVAATSAAAREVSASPDAIRVELALRVDPDPALGPVLLSRSGSSCTAMSSDAWSPCAGPPFQAWTAQAALGAVPVIRVAPPGPEDAQTSSPIVIPESGVLDPSTFKDALAGGALDGRVVEVTAALVIGTITMCDAAAGVDCRSTSNWGFAGDDAPGLPPTVTDCVSRCPDGLPGAGPYLFVVDGTELVYLGVLHGSLSDPAAATNEAAGRQLHGRGEAHTVLAIEGWLSTRDFPRLSDDEPHSDGTAIDPSWPVQIAVDVAGMDATRASIGGPIIVAGARRSVPQCPPTTRGCGASVGLFPTVLARYDPSRVVRVSFE